MTKMSPRCALQFKHDPPDGSIRSFLGLPSVLPVQGHPRIRFQKSGNRTPIRRCIDVTQNRNATIPAAIPVEELAAHMRLNPNKLRLAIGLAAAAEYTLDLGLGIQVKVEIIDEAHLSDEAVMELGHIGSLDFREPQEMLLAATVAASEQHQSLLAAPPASKRTQ